MPEGRMLKKRISDSKTVGILSSDSARLLYTWLIPHLDVEGRYSADPDIIKGHIFPKLKSMTCNKIKKIIQELARAKLVILYYANGEAYLQLEKFFDHNKIDREREAPSKIPVPPKSITISEQLTSYSGVTRTNSSLSKVNISKGKESIIARTCEDKSEPPHRRIKLNFENKKWEGILDEDKKLWGEAYPACNIEQELKKMIVWAIANPKKAKKSNYAKFINNWIGREQDAGGTKQSFGKKLETPEEYKERQRKALYGE